MEDIQRQGGGSVAELADWVQARARRTPEGAVRAMAKRRGANLGELLIALCDELGKGGSRWLMRRVVAGIEEELAIRQTIQMVNIPDGGTNSEEEFTFTFKLDFMARVALGLLREHWGGYFKRDFSDDVSMLLWRTACKCRTIGEECAIRVLRSIEWERDDRGAKMIGRGKMLAVPDVLAVPDETNEFGFRTMRDGRQ